MEEQIIKMVLLKDLTIPERELKGLSKEITSHIMEFIEWLKNQMLLEIIQTSKGTEWMWCKFKGGDEDEYDYYTSEEVYQYWLTNIKNQ